MWRMWCNVIRNLIRVNGELVLYNLLDWFNHNNTNKLNMYEFFILDPPVTRGCTEFYFLSRTRKCMLWMNVSECLWPAVEHHLCLWHTIVLMTILPSNVNDRLSINVWRTRADVDWESPWSFLQARACCLCGE